MTRKGRQVATSMRQAIKQVYGVSIPNPRDDGEIKHFRIDRYRTGFLLSLGDAGVFGCRYDGIGYQWVDVSYDAYALPEQQGLTRKQMADMDMERRVIDCAIGIESKGERLSARDSERLAKAVAAVASPVFQAALSQPNEADSGLIQQIDIDRANSDIVSVISGHIELKKTGKNYSACCPFHNEKSPSFSVAPDKQFYYCFGCGASGDAVKFVMDHTGADFREAVRAING